MSISDKALEGKVALVTGGSRGIGRETCVALAKRGATVVVNFRSNQEAAEETAALVQECGGQSVLAGFDVASSEAVKDGIDRVVSETGRLDIVVNNAGIAKNGLLMRFSDDDWQQTIDTNLAGAFYVARQAARYLLKAKSDGRLINLSSVVGETGNAGQAAYCASKAGLVGLTKSMARELAGRGVCVNAVSPGWIETDMTETGMPADKREELISNIPLKRTGLPLEVADLIAFLSGPEAAYITGQVIRVNGGMLM